MSILLNVKNLSKRYKRSAKFLSSGYRQDLGPLSFSLTKGQTLSIVGESGSGKSTLAKMLAGLIQPSAGEIHINGQPMHSLTQQQQCSTIRMIFNDPSSSLNPKSTIGRILSAPLEINTDLDQHGIQQRILETLNLVELLPDYLVFYPNMLSSVQQHKVALARAMILNPEIIIADEILASLDVSLRFKIVNLLLEIQKKKGTSYILVAHNMNLVRHMSDQIIVMHRGIIVENNTTEEIYNAPQAACTKQLLQSHQPDYRK